MRDSRGLKKLAEELVNAYFTTRRTQSHECFINSDVRRGLILNCQEISQLYFFPRQLMIKYPSKVSGQRGRYCRSRLLYAGCFIVISPPLHFNEHSYCVRLGCSAAPFRYTVMNLKKKQQNLRTCTPVWKATERGVGVGGLEWEGGGVIFLLRSLPFTCLQQF